MLHLSKLTAFADDKLNVAEMMMISVYDRVNNNVAKKENAGNLHFPFFLIVL